MRAFLLTLVATTVLSIILWQFGVAQHIWPAHPLLAITIIAGVGGSAFQMLLNRDAKRDRSGAAAANERTIP